ncbi:unnamed protein product, partial [Sphagnum troendelagicum]
MVDEFIYQFQSFCQYRAKLTQRTDQELAFLRLFDETSEKLSMGFAVVRVWNVVGVLNYLQALIEKSMILQILDKEKNANFTFTATDGYDYYGGTNVLEVLGYFSIAGLLHVHCLFVDYQSGLCALSPV